MLPASKELSRCVTFLKMKELSRGENIPEDVGPKELSGGVNAPENVGPKELCRGVNVPENVGLKELCRGVNCEHSSKCGTCRCVNIPQMWDPNGT